MAGQEDSPLLGRRRHCSDSGLPLPALAAPFTQEQLASFLHYFRQHSIYEWKIFQHLQGDQLQEGRQVPNYPGLDTAARSAWFLFLHHLFLPLSSSLIPRILFLLLLFFLLQLHPSSDTGSTALHLSCSWGLAPLTRALLQAGASPHVTNSHGSSPIHMALARGHRDLVQILLAHTPSLVTSFNTKNGFHPLHTAALYRDRDSVGLLLQAGARIDQDTQVRSTIRIQHGFSDPSKCRLHKT